MTTIFSGSLNSSNRWRSAVQTSFSESSVLTHRMAPRWSSGGKTAASNTPAMLHVASSTSAGPTRYPRACKCRPSARGSRGTHRRRANRGLPRRGLVRVLAPRAEPHGREFGRRVAQHDVRTAHHEFTRMIRGQRPSFGVNDDQLRVGQGPTDRAGSRLPFRRRLNRNTFAFRQAEHDEHVATAQRRTELPHEALAQSGPRVGDEAERWRPSRDRLHNRTSVVAMCGTRGSPVICHLRT